jgi:limonene-1,2-epoxide hydrolase
MLAVPLGRVRLDLLAGEVASECLNLFLLRGGLEVHGRHYIQGVVRRLVLVGAAVALVAAAPAAAAGKPRDVVRAWSAALNANDNERAAKLFAPNARVIQPGIDVPLTSHKLAVLFNDSLPCAGRVVAISVKGNRATATFILGQRPKHRCDAPGAKAAALFVVRAGKIVLWQQVPVPNGKPTA